MPRPSHNLNRHMDSSTESDTERSIRAELSSELTLERMSRELSPIKVALDTLNAYAGEWACVTAKAAVNVVSTHQYYVSEPDASGFVDTYSGCFYPRAVAEDGHVAFGSEVCELWNVVATKDVLGKMGHLKVPYDAVRAPPTGGPLECQLDTVAGTATWIQAQDALHADFPHTSAFGALQLLLRVQFASKLLCTDAPWSEELSTPKAARGWEQVGLSARLGAAAAVAMLQTPFLSEEPGWDVTATVALRNAAADPDTPVRVAQAISEVCVYVLQKHGANDRLCRRIWNSVVLELVMRPGPPMWDSVVGMMRPRMESTASLPTLGDRIAHSQSTVVFLKAVWHRYEACVSDEARAEWAPRAWANLHSVASPEAWLQALVTTDVRSGQGPWPSTYRAATKEVLEITRRITAVQTVLVSMISSPTSPLAEGTMSVVQDALTNVLEAAMLAIAPTDRLVNDNGFKAPRGDDSEIKVNGQSTTDVVYVINEDWACYRKVSNGLLTRVTGLLRAAEALQPLETGWLRHGVLAAVGLLAHTEMLFSRKHIVGWTVSGRPEGVTQLAAWLKDHMSLFADFEDWGSTFRDAFVEEHRTCAGFSWAATVCVCIGGLRDPVAQYHLLKLRKATHTRCLLFEVGTTEVFETLTCRVGYVDDEFAPPA